MFTAPARGRDGLEVVPACAVNPERRANWRVVEVLVSGVMYEGKDGSDEGTYRIDNLVAKRMFVPKFEE